MPLDREPVIGLCSSLEQARWGFWDQQAFLTPRSYVRAVQRAGGVAILLPADPRAGEQADRWLDLLDGLMLCGGADIDPSSYGAEPHPETKGTVPERDAFEIALTRAALERDVPLLGVCRGMQLLNVACGGTLIQHLPDDVGHTDHRRSIGTFENADHDVLLDEGTLAARAAGELRHRTKSHHHQGVARLGDGLEVTGRSVLDELPETIEMPGRRFVLGVQWHPEADPGSGVIAAFVRAAAEVAVPA